MLENGLTLDKVDLNKFVGSGVVLNLGYKKEGKLSKKMI